MLFDKFAKITEKKVLPYHSYDLQILNNTKLFLFEGTAHAMLPKSIDKDYIENNFFLPFPIVGVEDKASLVILIDDMPNQIGANCVRYFIEIMSSHALQDGFSRHLLSDEEHREQLEMPNIYCISKGIISEIYPTDKTFYANARLIDMQYVFADSLTIHPRNDEIIRDNAEMLEKEGCINAITALQQIAFMNSDNFFILEESPTKGVKNRKGKITRSHERERYTMLRPKDIREKLNLPVAARSGDMHHKRSSPRPHDRRAHVRTIHRDDPTRRRKVNVKATWIGESKAIVGKKFYRVLLDR